MGFELNRFQGDVDEELVCPICSGVLEEPLQAPVCEHAFCRACIQEWISRQPTCPVDRQSITSAQLRPVPRILRNLLARLCISCDNVSYGCQMVLKLDTLAGHVVECEYNPKRPLPCEQGCGLVIPKDELKEHNCVRELRALIHTQQQKLGEFQQELADQRFTIGEQKRELQLLKDFMRAMRISNPAMRAIADQMERDEVVRWSNSLTRARVTRWGGMISTPDEVLQIVIDEILYIKRNMFFIITVLIFSTVHCKTRDDVYLIPNCVTVQLNSSYTLTLNHDYVTPVQCFIERKLNETVNEKFSVNLNNEGIAPELISKNYRMIKRTLSESGCPGHILDELMQNCHERRWPAGLSSLETRQNNRRLYEAYVCKRVPGKQAVLVLQCDNSHMQEDMMLEPGIVMIFAHGIE